MPPTTGSQIVAALAMIHSQHIWKNENGCMQPCFVANANLQIGEKVANHFPIVAAFALIRSRRKRNNENGFAKSHFTSGAYLRIAEKLATKFYDWRR